MPPLDLLIATGIKIVLVLGFILTAVPMLVWLERKVIADFQARVGPSRVGPFGLLQSFADGIKLVLKESIVPKDVDHLLYFAAPASVIVAALSVVAVIPFGADLTINGKNYALVIADLPIAVLFVLALTSLGVYGIVLAGWASNNKYSLLGGLRSAAQMVSYELPMGMSLVAGLMIASQKDAAGIFNLSLREIVAGQGGGLFNWAAFDWRFGFLGLLALIIFYICGVAETNRAPFDLAEAETELVAGFLTEYGGLKWAMFFLGEYAAMLNVSAIATAVFLGGWHSPYPESLLGLQAGSIPYVLHSLLWFGLKIFAVIILYIHIRASLPRVRYDKLMSFGWKFLMPVSLALVLVLATVLTFVHPQKVPPALAAIPAATGIPPTGMPTPGGMGLPTGVPGGLPGGLPGGVIAPPAGNSAPPPAPPVTPTPTGSPAPAPTGAEGGSTGTGHR